jgi:hypothetical protein
MACVIEKGGGHVGGLDELNSFDFEGWIQFSGTLWKAFRKKPRETLVA